jgi:hypothetical protein
MTLVETLALTVGPTIAKAILKSWLKDSDIALNTTSSLVDLLTSKTKDKIAQQRGRRQFEEIGEKVAESLLPLFEEAHLEESGRVAVALAVAETLDKTPIDPELLAKRDLDPAELERYLLDSRPDATRDFFEAETALYRRIISESASSIVDIASQLPTFTERTFAEVLKREGLLLDKADQILDEVRRIREESRQANPEADAAHFEEEYRRAVVRKLDELELFGVEVFTASRRHRLSVAYVTLSVEQELSDADEEEPSPAQEVISPAERDGEDEEGKVIVSVDEALAGSRRLIIRGLAGSGKTTLLKWIAVRSASRTFEGQLSDWNNTIPFFIRLRQCVEPGLPAPEDFPGLVAPAIAGTMPAGWVHDQLKSDRAIMLVDGVDEVPQLQRTDVRSWLKELAETYEQTRFIVSSRPHAVEEGWMESEGFDDAELQPMELPDISTFIEHWHNAVREELQDEEEKAELSDLAENLKDVVRDRRPIRNLATNPMLCAMLCALHRDRRQQLPSDRIELYEACSYMLLERRDIERRIELRDYPHLSYRQKRALLEDLAYWMMTNNWPMLPIERADTRLSRKLKNMALHTKDVTAPDVQRLFIDRSGMIREPIVGYIDFTHRTFQEFLAAQAALDEGDIGVLVQNAYDDQWREVIILAAGLAGTKVREQLISDLIQSGDKETHHRHQLHLLAVACLETSVELGPTVRHEVRKRLAKLVPPKNITEAKALASAGELAVPYLKYNRRHKATFAAACVRALSLIGSEAALTALEGYGKDTRQTVWKELFKAMDSFERGEYSRRVFSQFCTEYLKLDRVSSLDGFQLLSSLESLTVRSLRQVSDLSPLAELTNLSSLYLGGLEQVSDLSPLRELTNLYSLDLSRLGQVGDLSPLAGLTNLSSLKLSGGFEKVSDLNPLAELTNLSSLTLWGFGKVSNLNPLAELTNLSSLALRGFWKVSDLSPLAGLINLSSLNLWDLEQVSDLSPLAGLINLSWLNLLGLRQVSDLSPLVRLKNLRYLSLFGIPAKVPKELAKGVQVIRL